MSRKVLNKLMIVHHFSHSRRSSCSDSPKRPLCALTPSSSYSSSDGEGERENTLRGRARQRVRKLAMGGGAAAPKGVSKDIPRGCMAVYVGKEKKRFIISTHYLNHYLFKALLKRSEEEYGFHYRGGLLIACEAVLFEHLLWLIGTNDSAARTTELEDLLEFYEF